MHLFKKIFFLLTPNERKKALLLLFMITIMAFLDMLGVASILPFMTVLTNPSVIETNFYINTLFKFMSKFGVQNNQQFLNILGILLFLLLIISLTFKAFTTYVQTKFIQMQAYSISKRLVEGYLHQPYSWFLNRNSADIGKTILSEVDQVIGNGINPLMELVSKGMVIFAIIILLVFIDPKVTIIVGFALGGTYLFIFYFVRSYLIRSGKERLKSNQTRFMQLSEAFGGVKEVKVGGLENKYINSFSNAALIFAKTKTTSQIISLLPRYILESIAMGGILLLLLYIISQSGSFNSALPLIAIYIFAGYRLMPALQQIYSSFTQLTFTGPALDKLYHDLNNLKHTYYKHEKVNLTLSKQIILNNINYSYPQSDRTAISNLNLKIPAKSTVGLVGSTGSGKTTIVDIILGLLEPQKGLLEVDGKVINEKNKRSWQSMIGYVPQSIFLSDDTIASNIAFGEDTNNINHQMVEKSAKIANIHNFITNELIDRYNTEVGERGVRLSGGQRQRIGIARALYHNPEVLILDEATSSLDSTTEKEVIEAVNNLRNNLTIIIIAHRLNTVKNCDLIFKFENGKILSQYKFDDLIKEQ